MDKKWIWGAAALAVGAGMPLAIHAFMKEPYVMEEKHIYLDTQYALGDKSIKVAHFTDVHLGPYTYKQLEKLVKTMNRMEPDVVLFTGDMFDDAMSCTFIKEAALCLAKIKAPLGKYCIWGNHDHNHGGNIIYDKVMSRAGFKLLCNEDDVINLVSGKRLRISGVDDALRGKPDFRFLKMDRNEDYHIVMIHEPDLAALLPNEKIDLALAGHSHGGQVRIPILDKLVLPRLGWKFPIGLYQIKNMMLYVHNGIGTTRMKARFNAAPHIAMHHLS